MEQMLTNENIFLTNEQTMRNYLALEVPDSDMLHLMLEYLGDKESLNGAIEMLRKTSGLIEIFKDMRLIKTTDDPRIYELTENVKWFND